MAPAHFPLQKWSLLDWEFSLSPGLEEFQCPDLKVTCVKPCSVVWELEPWSVAWELEPYSVVWELEPCSVEWEALWGLHLFNSNVLCLQSLGIGKLVPRDVVYRDCHGNSENWYLWGNPFWLCMCMHIIYVQVFKPMCACVLVCGEAKCWHLLSLLITDCFINWGRVSHGT